MIKNAIAYITRKRNRTLIIFIILTIVLSCLYSCLTIMKSSDEIEKALYESSNSSISITRKDGNYFNVNEFKDIEKLKEIEEKIIQYDGLAKLKDAKVVSGEQRINREDLSDEFKNVVSLEATNNTKRNILFSSGVFTIKEGKNIGENDKDSIIVHEEFAKQNNLKLGDEVDLELLDVEKSGKIKSHKFKIIGIFFGKKHETYTGLSSDFSENMVFTPTISLSVRCGTEVSVLDSAAVFTSVSLPTDSVESEVTGYNCLSPSDTVDTTLLSSTIERVLKPYFTEYGAFMVLDTDISLSTPQLFTSIIKISSASSGETLQAPRIEATEFS